MPIVRRISALSLELPALNLELSEPARIAMRYSGSAYDGTDVFHLYVGRQQPRDGALRFNGIRVKKAIAKKPEK